MTKTTRFPHIEFKSYFNKQLKAAPREIRIAFIETLHLFRDNPSHPFLRNHALKNKLAGFRSINVTDDWRALFRIKNGQIVFVEIGTHKQLYRRTS
jgi:addiction module RelE/StbE family toxin